MAIQGPIDLRNMLGGPNIRQAPISVPIISGGPDDQTTQLIQHILQQRQQQLAQPVPAPLPQRAPQAEMWQGKGSGVHNLVTGVATGIQNAVAQHKAGQMAKAEADWNQLVTAMQSGNQAALNAIMQDSKKLKNMAKALNQDWLNPEKTDVYREALKNVMAQQQQKGEAAQGMKALVGNLLHKNKQQAMALQRVMGSPEQQQAMQKEMLAKAPMGGAQEDPKTLLELVRIMGEREHWKAEEGIHKQEAEWRHEDRVDNLERQIAQGREHALEFQQTLNLRNVTEQDRVAQNEYMNDIRAGELGVKRQIADLMISGEEKERSKWLDESMREEAKYLSDAKSLQDNWEKKSAFGRATAGWFGGMTKADVEAEVKKREGRLQMMRSLSDGIRSGKISSEQATNAIYPTSGGPVAPPGYVLRDGPQGTGYYKIGAEGKSTGAGGSY